MTDSALQAPEFPSLDAIEAALWPALMLLVFVITAVLVDLMVILAARFRLVDLPNRRSAHSLPTARGGGVAIVLLSFIASLVVIVRWPSLGSRVLLGLVLPSVVIAGVGLIDDIRPLRPLLRLVFQLVVAAGMTLVLGPLFLPLYLACGGLSHRNRFEKAADRYAQTGRGWWPWT